MKTIERTMFKVKDLYNPEVCKDIMLRLLEIGNYQGRQGRMIGNLMIVPNPDCQDEVFINCIEVVSNAEYQLLLDKGEIKKIEERKQNEKSEEETESKNETPKDVEHRPEPDSNKEEVKNEPQG